MTIDITPYSTLEELEVFCRSCIHQGVYQVFLLPDTFTRVVALCCDQMFYSEIECQHVIIKDDYVSWRGVVFMTLESTEHKHFNIKDHSDAVHYVISNN